MRSAALARVAPDNLDEADGYGDEAVDGPLPVIDHEAALAAQGASACAARASTISRTSTSTFRAPNELVVMTGLSGSGKSSLAFDTIYAEGQRRYVESLSAYARQFLELMQKPDVDASTACRRRSRSSRRRPAKNPRSTVGTVTEIYDYMRLLWARVGVPYSPATGLPIESQTVSQMVDR
jgi:excinuclease ABC subunit A